MRAMKNVARYIVAILVLLGTILAGWFVLKLVLSLVIGAVSRTVMMIAVGVVVLMLLGVVAFRMRSGSTRSRL